MGVFYLLFYEKVCNLLNGSTETFVLLLNNKNLIKLIKILLLNQHSSFCVGRGSR